MSNPKLTWAVCIMAALSLGGCAVDATGTDDLEGDDAARVAQWYLSGGNEAPDEEDDGSTDAVDDEGAPVDDIVTAEWLSENPTEEEGGPFPDPWNPADVEKSAGTGNQD